MRSRNVLVVSAITASLLSGLWLRPKQPQAAAEAVLSKLAVSKPGVKSPVLLPARASQPKTKD
ncbi:MAG: lytic transglycosylase domain-containing protein, partial [Cyanobacteria bacterium MAG COS3_bin_20]|nr:lytic transglycosylase domain-containing protein [Cyanobacteria bacterium MAG COS3_bin_20]